MCFGFMWNRQQQTDYFKNVKFLNIQSIVGVCAVERARECGKVENFVVLNECERSDENLVSNGNFLYNSIRFVAVFDLLMPWFSKGIPQKLATCAININNLITGPPR